MQLHINKEWWMSELKVITSLSLAILAAAVLFFTADSVDYLKQYIGMVVPKEVIMQGLSILFLQSIFRAIASQISPAAFSHVQSNSIVVTQAPTVISEASTPPPIEQDNSTNIQE